MFIQVVTLHFQLLFDHHVEFLSLICLHFLSEISRNCEKFSVIIKVEFLVPSKLCRFIFIFAKSGSEDIESSR